MFPDVFVNERNAVEEFRLAMTLMTLFTKAGAIAQFAAPARMDVLELLKLPWDVFEQLYALAIAQREAKGNA